MHVSFYKIFEEEGDELPGRDHGDIVFTIHTRLHPVFERNGNNLYTKQTISLIEALTGFKKTITHLDQQAVPLERTGVTPFGFVETIKGAGMPLIDNPNSFGDLYVEYIVNFPANVDLGFVNGNAQFLVII
jgi:DnaJ-related protein SCJ1